MLDTKKTIITFDYQGLEADEIIRNLNNLYGTAAGTVPLDRDFGLDQEFISYPLDVAQNMLALEITEKTETYEPRAEVKEISFASTPDGTLIPTIIITRAEVEEEEGDE